MSETQQKIEAEQNEPENAGQTLEVEAESEHERQHRITDELQAKEKQSKGFIGFIAFVALILAIGAFIAGYLSLQEIGTEQANLGTRINTTEKSIASIESRSESSRSIAETVQNTSQQLQNRLDSMESKVGALDQKIDSNTSKLEQSDTAISESLNKLNESLRANKDDSLLVAEARHLVIIANQQAQLNHNPAAAAAALEAADQRLRDAADPALVKARQIITDDIIALRNVPNHDITGIALTLSELEKSVPNLPLRNEEQEAPPEEASKAQKEVSGIGGFFEKIWNDIKGLVSIRRNTGEANAALLPPGQRFFLQQNLRLKLETARLALLQRDTTTFHDSLNTAKLWLETYFDSGAPGTSNLLSTIDEYQTIELMPALPDISSSLKALDAWRSKQQNAAISATAEVTAS